MPEPLSSISYNAADAVSTTRLASRSQARLKARAHVTGPARNMTLLAPDIDLRLDRLCLFLDVDGTLLEFAETPSGVSVDDRLRSLLERASARVDGALALVSGRSLRQLDSLFAPQKWPAAGLHGLERRDAAGVVHRHGGPDPKLDRIRPGLEAIVARHPGLILEDKGATLALHYRRAPGLADEIRREMDELLSQSGGDFHLQPGSFVLEVKPTGVSKANAIDAFLAEPPFAGRRPLFAGDDLTDLDGFAAVERHSGVSVAVGDRVAAMIQLPDPDAFHLFLDKLTQAAETIS